MADTHRMGAGRLADGCRTLNAAMAEVDLRQQVVERALAELRAWQERYRIYSESAAVRVAIDAAAAPSVS